jgi:formylglycine-generating enzyme required for sulfatase activity
MADCCITGAPLGFGRLKEETDPRLFKMRAMILIRPVALTFSALLVAAGCGINDNARPYSELPKEITNTIGMRLVLIPPGEFLMGSPETEEGRGEYEGPQHQVKITRAYYMGIYHVTKDQYAAFINDSGYKPKPVDGDDKGYNDWKSVGFEQAGDHPVVNVSWSDARAFCKWLSKKEGKTYRLPTEAEWEYACRAGTTRPFAFGETISTNDANYDGNSVYGDGKKGEYRQKTTPVGSFKPNAWGLYDMHGNAWEWCQDGFEERDYQKSPVVDPTGPEKSSFRVIRGGGFRTCPGNCRSAFRWGSMDEGDTASGFRVVLVPSLKSP